MIDAAAAFTGIKRVEPRFALDEARLTEWMTANVAGFEGPLSLGQFKGGQSNPTYRLATPGHAYVLRRKPSGALLQSAHAVDREYRVIAALHAAGFAVARPHALCLDEGVIGAMFYIMDEVQGRVLWNGALPGFSPQERRAAYASEIETLARLHGYDPNAIGLGDYGRPGNYMARQVERWTRQYRASETEPRAAMEALIGFLPSSVPPQERTGIVHGDYRLDNLIFAPERPEVAAVLDWELSTLGDPLADFAYMLVQWDMPVDGRAGLRGLDLAALGIPTMAEACDIYCAATGRDGVPALDWYFAFSLFRLAAILQGIAGRVRDGTAASPEAARMTALVGPLADAAWRYAARARA